MNLWQGAVLGVVQGLTEFLPISSTAHLRVVPALLGWPDPGAAFSAVIQLGTLLAVLVYFARDLGRMARALVQGLLAGRPWEDAQARLAWMILLGTVPIGVAGLLGEHAIETWLRSLWVVAGALVALALVLALAERLGRRKTRLGEAGWLQGLSIGLAQTLALIPGVSRSGVTITAGLFVGLERADAARFSFLLSVPAVAASGLYEGYKLLGSAALAGVDWPSLLLATFTAASSGYLAVAGLIRFLQRRSTMVFVVYRILLGVAILALCATGTLDPLA